MNEAGSSTARARAAIEALRRRMLRRRRLDLHLRLLAAAAALVFAPLLSFSLGALDEARLWAIILATALGAVTLAEFLLAGARPDAREAARRLDAMSGDDALFASALDRNLDQAGGAIHELFRRQLDAALASTRGRDPLPRRNLTLVKLLLALVVLDTALVALPRRETKVLDAELGDLKSYLAEAGRSDTLAPDQKDALTTLEGAETREEMIRRADEVWRREQAARLDFTAIEEALDRLELALESGETERARSSAGELRALIDELDRTRARELAARLHRLAERFPAKTEGVDLDELASAAEGAGAGLAEGEAGSRVAAAATMEKILVALYDGLGTLPPSANAGATEPRARNRDERRAEPPFGGPGAIPIEASPADRALIERYFRLRAR